MVVACSRCSLFARVLMFSAISALVRSIAPGDSSGQKCAKETVPDSECRLLDSNWYGNLKTKQPQSAGWSDKPYNSWIEGGAECSRSLTSNGSDNWLFTQLIDKTATVSYDLQITVDIHGQNCSRNCSDGSSVNVYYFPTNDNLTNCDMFNHSSYAVVRVVSFDPDTEAKVSLTFSLGSQYHYFCLAFEEKNACFKLTRLLVSYKLCPKRTENLVVYPRTPVGGSAVSTFATCQGNATINPGSSLNITCNTDGNYSGSPNCSCQDGYATKKTNCSPCPAGTYARSGDESCKPCPSNSFSKERAAPCDCNGSYYWITNETCLNCLSNSNSTQGVASCDCDANYYWAIDGICLPCPANTNPPPGSKKCNCVSGYFRSHEENASLPCTKTDNRSTSPTYPTASTPHQVTTTANSAMFSRLEGSSYTDQTMSSDTDWDNSIVIWVVVTVISVIVLLLGAVTSIALCITFRSKRNVVTDKTDTKRANSPNTKQDSETRMTTLRSIQDFDESIHDFPVFEEPTENGTYELVENTNETKITEANKSKSPPDGSEWNGNNVFELLYDTAL